MTGHAGSDKSTYGQRIERYCKWGGAIYESIDYSSPELSGEIIVAKLIVDDGIKSRNHRKVIFQNIYEHIGIAEAEHTEYGRVVVIDYGAQILSFKEYESMQITPITEEVKAIKVDTSKVDWEVLAKKVGEEINKLRNNPKHLTKQLERSLTCFQKFKILTVKGREPREFKEGASAYIEAIEFWETQRAVKSINSSENLQKSAMDHVKDLEKSGLMTQIGNDGSIPKDRIEKYTGIDSLWSENLLLGGIKPREIVEYMLVSDGDKSRGQRKNLFNPKIGVMGIAWGLHPECGSVTVVDFVGKEIEKGGIPAMEIETTEKIPEDWKKKLDKIGVLGRVEIK